MMVRKSPIPGCHFQVNHVKLKLWEGNSSFTPENMICQKDLPDLPAIDLQGNIPQALSFGWGCHL